MVSFSWNQPELVDRIAKLEKQVALLQRNEERATIALAQSSVGIFEWHLGKRSIYVSPILQDLLGYEGENMPGHLDAWLEHLHADDRLRAQYEVNEALTGNKQLFRSTYRILRCDGSLRRFLFQVAIIHGRVQKRPQVVRALGTAIDVTDVAGLLSRFPN